VQVLERVGVAEVAMIELGGYRLGLLAAELGHAEDFSQRPSRQETSRLQDAPGIIAVWCLAGIVLIRSQTD
jgi:hypothetical protein